MESMNERGQVIILFALLVSGIIISLSSKHAQNLLAGMESSRTIMVFPKEEIRNLRDIAETEFVNEMGLRKYEFDEFTYNVSRDIRLLYAQKGSYAEIAVFASYPSDITNTVSYFNVRITYIGGGIEYNDTTLCRLEGCI